MGLTILPVAAVIATMDRAPSLARTLDSLAAQEVLPAELIAVDGSANEDSRAVLENWGVNVGPPVTVRWKRAEKLGAAAQRNQGVALATQPFICFLDDDIRFEPGCVRRLWEAINSDPQLGGVNAMITNQKYQTPGLVSRTMFTLLHGRLERSFAGRVIGPAIHLLPEDRDELPEAVPVEWLNTTCTLYRGEALPSPPFDSVFAGYSMMEDLTLSLRVGREWRLANARTARVFHDSQPGAYKSDVTAFAAMELTNRHYVMTEILRRKSPADYCRLLLWEAFQLAVGIARTSSRKSFPAHVRGKLRAIRTIRSVASSGTGLTP